MQQYNDKQDLSGDAVTDDMANAVLLRCDIHRAFDNAKFVIVPKEGQWVPHFLDKTAHYSTQYHNRRLIIPKAVARQFFLARFAWALFPSTKNFHESGSSRLVRIPEKNAETGDYEEMDKILGSEDLRKLLSIGRGRSSSPRKRSAPDEVGQLESGSTIIPELTDHSSCSLLAASSSHPVVHDLGQGLRQHSVTKVENTLPTLKSPLPLYVASNSRTHQSSDAERHPLPQSVRKRSRECDQDETDEQARISNLRFKHLRSQRPTTPKLICCDYSEAERANARGETGKAEYGGGHLCLECLGVEIRSDDLEDIDETDDNGDNGNDQ